MKEGFPWRAIPHDFPKGKNVWYHYDVWAAPDENGDSVLDQILRKLVEAQREQDYRNARTTMITVDSKNIQNADIAEEKAILRCNGAFVQAAKSSGGWRIH